MPTMLANLGILSLTTTTTRKRVNVSRARPMTCYEGSPMLSSKLSLYPRRHTRASMPSQLAQCRGHGRLNDYLGLAFSKS
ncbi:hypothetical protein GGG16DRAFT_112769 [Schizophyllum commune]